MKRRAVRIAIAAVAVVIAGVFAVLHAGSYLVVNRPERSDVIVVLAGDHNDLRYWSGLDLLRQGYGRHMVLDVPGEQIYGRTYADYAADFIARSAGDQKPEISICVITRDSTVEEAANIGGCLNQIQDQIQDQIHPTPRSALLVTSDFHTRRALSILRARLPQYRWSVSAVTDAYRFGEPWWRHREWAKTCVYEWQKLIWWKLFESWRK